MALTLIPGGGTPEDWTTLLKKKGKELAQIPYNAYVLFKYHADFRGTIRWNKVTLTVEVLGGVLKDCPDPTNFDTVVTHAQDYLASVHDLSLGREEVGRRLAYVAMENGYDPLKDYLDGLVWDNQKRVDTWLIDYAGAKPTSPDDGYVSFVGRKFIVSTVARAYQPGCKADVVLVAEGGQGSHKSTMFKNLGGEWYTEASGVLGDKDSKQLIGAAWICELPDMSSFSRTNRNSMKAFFSSSVDRYRPPYDKATIATPRRCCFVATTNDEQYLLDPTGNRRFHPVMLGEIDRAAIYKNRDQLFAEAVAIYKAAFECPDCLKMDTVVAGELPRCPEHSWWLTPEQEITARVHTSLREEQDTWGSAVLRYVVCPTGPQENGKSPEPTTANILVYGLQFNLRDIKKDDEMRVSSILRRAKYIRERRGHDFPWMPGPEHPDFKRSKVTLPVTESIASSL